MDFFLLHLRDYLNFDMRMGRASFVLFNVFIVFLAVPLSRFIIPEEVLIAAAADPDFITTYRPDLITRSLITSFVLILLPAYVKRLKDINFPYIELALVFVFAPNVIDAVLSEGGHALLGTGLMIINFAGFIFTVYLFFKEGDADENEYGVPEDAYFRNLKDEEDN